jgi:hypothetical protein
MAHAITSATQTQATTMTQSQPVAKPASAVQASAPAKVSSTPKDTVQISSTAQTALQESLETPVQTARAAVSGDRQAQRLLARETAAKKA